MGAEAERLVDLMAELVRANGGDPQPHDGWTDAARKLLERAPASRVEAVIRYSQSDEFWRSKARVLPYVLSRWETLDSQAPVVAQSGETRTAREARWQAMEPRLRRTLEREARHCVTGEGLDREEVERAVEAARQRVLKLSLSARETERRILESVAARGNPVEREWAQASLALERRPDALSRWQVEAVVAQFMELHRSAAISLSTEVPE